ncbi:beta-lactamase-type transpeptidase fold domain containing protein [Colletotrichum tofieldiae]|uniref:Beta-lactamase-type transpeptidase fold domain containing protein n=1 Tax=Colletotrichum tofieldiae TaxID=708197 RepID=A0A166VEZ9_9PEZI|nr:beta-lactamase-type transpeptidase fold domain containing protein [Colletotrichum tofieldiae]GKT65870.1 beta-lactamase-type transpeptidase fold domain containing protein [Colletotrichum tofieldiae]GKT70950.1 beta-lactamase-type transpeptidase fold domain containing protein [Colletotrichum tofieldiae]
MPCFKGIAVSIHANGAPLPEHGMQKQSRLSRISTYIPVPQPSINPDSNKPEPAKFAISITLLTPGLPIPYSTPKPTETNPYPKPQFVGGLPTAGHTPSKFSGVVNPYIPMTNSENETIAAYIYFDGRSKEEVATLLRPGEETWVNSRWVQIPDSEGGGLAEREFLFREVGLERWLNGLDLQGHDAAEKLERRRQKFEKRRRRQKATTGATSMQVEEGSNGPRDTLRYGADDGSPVEAVFGEDDSDSLSDDDDIPEATGQIKVLMFRVLASGEIKKGEYSPQFDAHDDDDDAASGNQGNGKGGVDADVEHTTSFAKPKTLDPKTISTQTVTGIDGPDKPYASFTFFYRGERQLQKIGIIASSKANQATPGSAKRRSGQLDFSNLGPLKTSGTVGFSAFRDQDTEATRRRKARKKSNGNVGGALNDDSDDDDEESELIGKMQDIDEKEVDNKLAPEDVKFQGELADGVNRIHLKRAHSVEAGRSVNAGDASSAAQSGLFASSLTNPTTAAGNGQVDASPAQNASHDATVETTIGSPMKKHRPSINAGDSQVQAHTGGSNIGFDDILNRGTVTQPSARGALTTNAEEEEL